MATTQTSVGSKASGDKAKGRSKDPAKAKADAVAEAKSFAPELSARIGSTPRTKFRGNPDIFGRLVEDHDKHRALLAMIQDTTSGDPEQRKRLFEAFCKEVQSHANAEDQALWSAVLRVPKSTDDARHAVAEHKELDKLMADLAARDYSSPGWLRRFAALKEAYLHHIAEEEQEQFKAAEKVLTDKDLKSIKSLFENRKKAEKAQAKVEKKIRLKN